LLRGLAACVFLIAGATCSPEAAPRAGATIDREAFIATYVGLRVAALRADEQVVSDDARDEVLAENGVSGDDLLRFAEVHGGDVEFMRDVWNEVELRMDALRPGTEAR
jgi:hypothetical protein